MAPKKVEVSDGAETITSLPITPSHFEPLPTKQEI